MTIILPIVYLFFGWALGKIGFDIKRSASSLLTKLAIPIVIAWNISTHFKTMGVIILSTIVVMYMVYYVGKKITTDPIKNLCFYYLNIGWLGLPIATSVFGNEAATIIISAYVGSSIFGNTIGAATLSKKTKSITSLMGSPPLISVLIGIVLIPFNTVIQNHVEFIYNTAKLTMSILGMLILGLWLSNTTIKTRDIKNELLPYALKSLVWGCAVTLIAGVCALFYIPLTTIQWKTLYLLCLLPPAANIIVLETHYCHTGKSAPIILCSTIISIAFIMLYVLIITLWL